MALINHFHVIFTSNAGQKVEVVGYKSFSLYACGSERQAKVYSPDSEPDSSSSAIPTIVGISFSS
jgi:hypothetical protein